MDVYQTAAYAGVASLLSKSKKDIFPEDIQEDLEGEQETIPDLDANDLVDQDGDDDHDDDNHAIHIPDLERTIGTLSKGVTDDTESGYTRLGESCVNFLLSLKLIGSRDAFFSQTPLANTPLLIVTWIMNDCDTVALDGSAALGVRSSYTHAQKMRASMTYIFGRKLGAGQEPWKVSGTTVSGNPSISDQVATYMVSLRRRKVHDGETQTSARAITPAILAKLYDHNHLLQNFDLSHEPQPGRRQNKNLHFWGGPRARRAVQAIYTIAFLCLLRVDEVLRIRIEDIEFVEETESTAFHMILTLPFRKTHQFGDIKPFVLYAMPDHDAHLCPVRAMAEWISASSIDSGYLFRRMASRDRPSSTDTPMTSQQFLEMFRNNLIDVGIHPAPYGTHSFRRGGCQYLHCERRWFFRRICEWGGWSTEFSNLTIVKYLISWNDSPTERREDFFNPAKRPVTKCFYCGRTCHCA